MGLFIVGHLIDLATFRGMPGLAQTADNLKNSATNIFQLIESSVAFR